LSALDAATELAAMDIAGWNLHPLKGALKDHWSVKVNGNWRSTFRSVGTDAEIVNYQDYH
jgi:toxin HigB-1